MKQLLLSFSAALLSFYSIAHEGMWIPTLLQSLNESDMKLNGLKLSADDIYSINHSSLKDAIVLFGGGCTAEVISDQGLILTNHHCGFGEIQSHSSVEHDYLTNGFWAYKKSEELPNPELTATFIVRIENVTEKMGIGITEAMDLKERDEKTTLNSKQIIKEATENTKYEAQVKPFFYGNEYYLIVTETFKDVRLVGAPPSSIGKFGGDTDNWAWPRHTGDFSIFRIYADKNNQPAAYAETNIPFTPKKSLEISMAPVMENDFTMVYGFPGVTQHYLTSSAVKLLVEKSNPLKIEMRDNSLAIINQTMASSAGLKIKYAQKQSRIANAWKKWMGQNMGLKRFNVIDEKIKEEDAFAQKIKSNNVAFKKYADVLPKLDSIYSIIAPYQLATDYFAELVFYGPEIIRFSNSINEVAVNYSKLLESGEIEKSKIASLKNISSFFKDYDKATDQRIFSSLFNLFVNGMPANLKPVYIEQLQKKYKGNWTAYADYIYGNSIFSDQEKLETMVNSLTKKNVKKLLSDPVYILSKSIYENHNTRVRPEFTKLTNAINSNMQLYLKAQMEMFPDQKFWADANSTLRLTYGKAGGSEPFDGMEYKYYTTLEGVMQKYVPGDVEFDVNPKLIELYKNKDYGSYGVNGELRLCFTAANHTTGGNSGSPVLDANGRLIGLNFDRSWESTMSDVKYNSEICRNIAVDIKYVLFVIDKYAGAKNLIEELKLIY
jgi:Peptidase S46